MPTLKVILFSICLFLFILSIPKPALAVTTECQQATAVVDSNKNTLVTIDTRTPNFPKGTVNGTVLEIDINDASGGPLQKATTVVQDGLATFTLGKLTPGPYGFALFLVQFSDKSRPYQPVAQCNPVEDNAVFIVPDSNQGGSISSCTGQSTGRMQLSSLSPRTTEPLVITVNSITDSNKYCIGVFDLNQVFTDTADNSAVSVQPQCQQAKNGTITYTFNQPLPSKSQVTLYKEGDTGSLDCQIVTFSQPVSNALVPPTPSCKPGEPSCSTAGGIPCDTTTGKPNSSGDGILTAIGCIPTEPGALIKGFLKFATGIGGGIAFLLMLLGSFQMITSQGNPDNLKKGNEQFTSAIIGLLFIIFSVLLLEIIGIDILGIPGLKR